MLQLLQIQLEVARVRQLNDHNLLDVYERAVMLNLDQAFIDLLASEIKRRNLVVSDPNEQSQSA
ncbi:sporulation histidine kinase inhibitor Sda [Brevibacillus sp. SYSU BS000544]|uniref:sporulation histidine kinase inhibitor Sda n=1 Tax=Brevibacillus sp. SYSU BS000544 TaxID=3416443 RepID=UPI003CE554F7